jgi:hypothetical protein
MRHQAIRTLYPSVVTIDHLGSYDKDGNAVTMTESDVSEKVIELQAAHDAKAYARTRETAYPSIGDQLDMLWHAVDADATLKTKYADFHTAIKTVKDATPKP